MSETGLPNYIRTCRRRVHLTQGEVAFLLGTKSTAGVCRHERFRQNPNLENLLAYEMLFRTPVRSLFSEAQQRIEIKLKDRIRLLVQKLGKSRCSRATVRKLELLNALLQEESTSRPT